MSTLVVLTDDTGSEDNLASITEEYDLMVVGMKAMAYPKPFKYLCSWSDTDFKKISSHRKGKKMSTAYVEICNTSPEAEGVYARGAGNDMFSAKVGLALGYDNVIVVGGKSKTPPEKRFVAGWNTDYSKIRDKVRLVGGYPAALFPDVGDKN